MSAKASGSRCSAAPQTRLSQPRFPPLFTKSCVRLARYLIQLRALFMEPRLGYDFG